MRYWRFVAALGFVGVVAVGAAASGQSGASPDDAGARASLRERCRAAAAQGEELPRRCHRRGALHRVVHSEAKVVTDDGFATVIIDAGEVTAVDPAARSITIKRADGETVSLTGNDETRVRASRERAGWEDIEVGDRARLVQIDDGDGPVLRLIGVAGGDREASRGAPAAEDAVLDV